MNQPHHSQQSQCFSHADNSLKCLFSPIVRRPLPAIISYHHPHINFTLLAYLSSQILQLPFLPQLPPTPPPDSFAIQSGSVGQIEDSRFPSVLPIRPTLANIEAKCCVTGHFSNKDQHLPGFILFSHYIDIWCDRLDQLCRNISTIPSLTTSQRLTRFLDWNRTLMLPSPECKVKYVCFIGNLKCPPSGNSDISQPAKTC